MDTARIDVIYRPMRIAWLLDSGDIEGFRKIARLSCTLAGGRYNPIVLADCLEPARLIERFRPDIVISMSDTEAVKRLAAKYVHLEPPYFGGGELHFGGSEGRGGCHVLDIRNLLTRWHTEREWREVIDFGLRQFTWVDEDPLRDVFLIEHGAFPAPEDVHLDYAALLTNAAAPNTYLDLAIQPDQPIPVDAAIHPGFAFMGRFKTEPYALDRGRGWDYPGFFVGSANDIQDLVAFWNLRAANVLLRFVDLRHLARLDQTLPVMQENVRQRIAHLDAHRRQVAVWCRDQLDADTVKTVGGDDGTIFCHVGGSLWNGLNLLPPRMVLGSTEALGVIVDKSGRQSLTFSLLEKPFSNDNHFYTQHLIASVSMYRGRMDADETFSLPYIPELNETCARAMYLLYTHLRLEPGRLGLVIGACDADASVSAMPTSELVKAIFEQVGLKSKLSNAGLITRQLITQMGGIDGVRVFKIPGVRRLIRTSGLNESITKTKAYQLIGGQDPDNLRANFADYRQLYIEPRPFSTDLTVPEVFSHLVAQRVFRLGADVLCPKCNLTSWLPLDDLKQQVSCSYCGADVDTTRKLSGDGLVYRRSGLLGIERNLQGAIPVALVLQQLWLNAFSGLRNAAIFSPSLNIEAANGAWPTAKEIDFFAIELGQRLDRQRNRVVFGEAKDWGHPFDANDVETMKAVAAAFPEDRYEVFILFAKLNAFTAEEIALAAPLAQTHNVILLSDQELEPLYAFDRTGEELRRQPHDLEGFVRGTVVLHPDLRRRPLAPRMLRPQEEAKGADEGKPSEEEQQGTTGASRRS